MLKRYWWLGLVMLVLVAGGVWWLSQDKQVVLSPEAPWLKVERPLKKYSFPELRKQVFVGSEIKLERVLNDEAEYTSHLFFYESEGKKISGMANIPKSKGPLPVVIMIRGYVDQEIYETGVGTSRVAEVLARNGYITLAPDFLGYGQSDMPPENPLHERFMRSVQILELIASVKNLDKADEEKIYMWGHSNGGQIALSVLEISGREIPTSLWAPVSKPFPYSVLYYTDEFDDYGRALRKVVAGFEAQYEADEYSIHNYYDWIEAPIQIHQGTADEAVFLKWSEELEEALKELDKQVELFVYPGADHNLVGGWDQAVERDINFFR
jgi:dipeptidyl aminopeptidase/acylaminoacyl peptidase